MEFVRGWLSVCLGFGLGLLRVFLGVACGVCFRCAWLGVGLGAYSFLGGAGSLPGVCLGLTWGLARVFGLLGVVLGAAAWGLLWVFIWSLFGICLGIVWGSLGVCLGFACGLRGACVGFALGSLGGCFALGPLAVCWSFVGACSGFS